MVLMMEELRKINLPITGLLKLLATFPKFYSKSIIPVAKSVATYLYFSQFRNDSVKRV